MLSSRTVDFVRCSTTKGKCFCSPRSLLSQFSNGLLPYKDIPHAPSLPLVGNMPYIMRAGGIAQRHKYIDSLHKKLGPIFIDKAAGKDILFIADPEATRLMFGIEGTYPSHLLFPLWTDHLKIKNIERGLLFMGGKEWRDARDPFNFMHKIVYTDEQYEDIISITKELLSIWKKNPPKNLRYHLYSWSFECAGVNILGRRFGFLDKLRRFNEYSDKHLEEDSLAKATFHYDKTIDYFFPLWLKRILKTPSWRNYMKNAEIEIKTVSKYVEQGIQECISDNPSEMAKRSVLYKVITDGRLDLETIKRIVTDFVISASFSTSNASTWALYTLGRHPEVTEKVRRQVFSSVAAEDFKISNLLKTTPLLNGAIKECFRLYPTAPEINRIIAQNTVFSGYFVPEESIIVASMHSMGRDPNCFSNPECFMPERWARENQKNRTVTKQTITKVHHPIALLPFAHSRRNCIGKELALSDITILLLEALRTYSWTSDEVDSEYHYVITPSKPVELKLKPLEN